MIRPTLRILVCEDCNIPNYAIVYVDNIGVMIHSTMTCGKCSKTLKEVYKKQGSFTHRGRASRRNSV